MDIWAWNRFLQLQICISKINFKMTEWWSFWIFIFLFLKHLTASTSGFLPSLVERSRWLWMVGCNNGITLAAFDTQISICDWFPLMFRQWSPLVSQLCPASLFVLHPVLFQACWERERWLGKACCSVRLSLAAFKTKNSIFSYIWKTHALWCFAGNHVFSITIFSYYPVASPPCVPPNLLGERDW